ncbi:unnamed protein product [Enterobius vermicularis]|uniref:BHLH domain-containing protein n=1 Tax=Enterobius vermicularis TaxID=51028 RepID=A0A0N4VDI6_ENTVE|nr:unnamed protein product [Enterobius vermicularis]
MKPQSEETQRRLAAEREKGRMRALNTAFDQLRQKLKTTNGKRLTKIRTLRLAIDYIEELQQYLYNDQLLQNRCSQSLVQMELPVFDAENAFCGKDINCDSVNQNFDLQSTKEAVPFTQMQNYNSFVPDQAINDDFIQKRINYV